LTFPLGLSSRPGLGRCFSTLPFFLALEAFLVILPTVQWALLSFARALLSVRPTILGTRHFAVNLAVAAWLPVIESRQVALPEQSPDQPAKMDFLVGEAVSMTAVP